MIIDVRTRPHTAFFNHVFWPEPTPEMKPYVERYHGAKTFTKFPLTTVEKSTEVMLSMGVDRAIIFGGNPEENAHIYEITQDYPDVYWGMAGVDLSLGLKAAMADLKRCYTEYNFLGFGINPYLSKVYSNDKKYYPFYALSEEMGKTVHIHSSIHYSPFSNMELGNPKYIDEIAIDFPDLRIIIGHAGRGFGMRALYIADRHPNVYTDFTSIHPRYIDPEVLHAGNSFLKNKVMYGSSMPALPWNLHEEWRRVINEGVHDRFFWKNAVRAFNLDLDVDAIEESEKKKD